MIIDFPFFLLYKIDKKNIRFMLFFSYESDILYIMKNNFEEFELDMSDVSEKHRTSTEEKAFYSAVAQGNIEAVKKNCKARRFSDADGVGTLSRDPVMNLKYHFVITCAMTTRICIQQGLIEEQAFRLSDYYIQQLDDLHTTSEVEALHDTMVLDFATRMRMVNPDLQISQPVQNAINYIYVNVNAPVTVGDVADAVGVSKGYLSHLFKKEMGVSVSDYIRQKKVESATNLLKYSPYSMVEIANRLSFSSQSHFIQTFKKSVGITPLKYREKYGRSEWTVQPRNEMAAF